MRFLHTADWHLGMTRRFLPPEAQARYGDDRIQAVRDMAALALDEGCDFVVACGDLFDSNHVDRQVVARALDALAEFTVPVYLLPGNHDPLDAASVYRSRLFADRLPAGVRVIRDAEPLDVAPGVQLVGAPWHARRPVGDLAAAALAGLAPAPGVLRVLVAHGAVDCLSPDSGDPALIHVEALRHALFSGAVAYVALGDRHSAGEVGDDPRIRYAGSPVATDMGEVNPGTALVVTLDAGTCDVREHHVGRWTFRRIEARLDGLDDIAGLDAELEAVPDRARAVVRLSLVGTLGVGRPPALDYTGLTTPDPVLLQATFRRLADAGLAACAIEASSIGIAERRLDGTRIEVAVFTNFTQDHLDYHGTMDAYWQAKAELFDWPGLQAAVVNLDDEKGAQLADTLAARGLPLWTYSLQRPACLQGRRIGHGVVPGPYGPLRCRAKQLVLRIYVPERFAAVDHVVPRERCASLVGQAVEHQIGHHPRCILERDGECDTGTHAR